LFKILFDGFFPLTFQSLAVIVLSIGVIFQKFYMMLTLRLCVLCGSQKTATLPYATSTLKDEAQTASFKDSVRTAL